MTTTNPKAARAGDVRLETLTPYECWQLVTDAAGPDGIARVVWAVPSGPAIVPVNYTVADGFLWFQTAAGSRLARECCEERVLVEVDQVDVATHTGWSVVVAGVATCVDATEEDGLLGDTLLVWPDGPRDVLFKLEPAELTGRRLRHG
jgi:uncharacterized protein